MLHPIFIVRRYGVRCHYCREISGSGISDGRFDRALGCHARRYNAANAVASEKQCEGRISKRAEAIADNHSLLATWLEAARDLGSPRSRMTNLAHLGRSGK